MLNRTIFKIMVFGLVLSFSAGLFAQPVFADHPEEEVLPEAGLTSASPFHVFERFGDWARLNVLTFGAVRKAEVKVQIAEKRLAELKAVVEAGADASVVENAEGFVDSSSTSLQNDADTLDARGQDVSGLIEKLNALSLKQQSVLEGVLERAPEQAKEALARALENSRKGLERAEEVLGRQVEKKLIKEEKAKEILTNSVERLKEQIENRSEKIKEIASKGEVPPEVQAAFEEKIKLLEDRLINIESKEEFKEARAGIKEGLKDAASSVLELRAEHKLRDEVSEGFLKDVEGERFDVAQRAREAIAMAEKAMIDARSAVSRAESAGKVVPENVKELLRNAEEHFKKAKEAFEAKNFGEAFGQATSAFRNASAAIKSITASVQVQNLRAVEAKPAETGAVNAKPLPVDRLQAEQKPTSVESKPVSDLNSGISNTASVVPTRVDVVFTDEGFRPSEIKVRKGGTVVWTNKSSVAMWPASAVHPTHDIYPQKGGCLGSAFDACRRVAPGETYEFKFDHVGTWKYHDHIGASNFGAVTVVE